MSDTSAALAVLTGLAVRLMIPILITVLVVLVLTSLDRHWQTEGTTTASRVQKPACRDTKHSSAEQRKACRRTSDQAHLLAGFPAHQQLPGSEVPGCPVFAGGASSTAG
jgi:hypothetical protein